MVLFTPPPPPPPKSPAPLFFCCIIHSFISLFLLLLSLSHSQLVTPFSIHSSYISFFFFASTSHNFFKIPVIIIITIMVIIFILLFFHLFLFLQELNLEHTVPNELYDTKEIFFKKEFLLTHISVQKCVNILQETKALHGVSYKSILSNIILAFLEKLITYLYRLHLGFFFFTANINFGTGYCGCYDFSH